MERDESSPSKTITSKVTPRNLIETPKRLGPAIAAAAKSSKNGFLLMVVHKSNADIF